MSAVGWVVVRPSKETFGRYEFAGLPNAGDLIRIGNRTFAVKQRVFDAGNEAVDIIVEEIAKIPEQGEWVGHQFGR